MDIPAEDFVDLLDRVREGDEEATTTLWQNYFQPLVRLAGARLPRNLRRTGDEEDIALSAFHSFIAGVRRDQFPDLAGPDNLWGLLITLTSRKVNAHLRRATRQKRGGGQVRGESVFIDTAGNNPSGGLEQFDAAGDVDQIRPDLRLELAEACEALLEDLADDQLRQIAVMRMDGYLVDDIAAKLDISKRAVERRLQLIRKIWSESAAESNTNDDCK